MNTVTERKSLVAACLVHGFQPGDEVVPTGMEHQHDLPGLWAVVTTESNGSRP